MRATGIGWMSGIGRVGAILSGFVGAHLLGSGWSLLQVTGILTVPVVIAALAILLKMRGARSNVLRFEGESAH